MTESDTFMRKKKDCLQQCIEETYKKVEKLSSTKTEISNSLVAKYLDKDMSAYMWSIATKCDELGNNASKCFSADVRGPKSKMTKTTKITRKKNF